MIGRKRMAWIVSPMPANGPIRPTLRLSTASPSRCASSATVAPKMGGDAFRFVLIHRVNDGQHRVDVAQRLHSLVVPRPLERNQVAPHRAAYHRRAERGDMAVLWGEILLPRYCLFWLQRFVFYLLRH